MLSESKKTITFLNDLPVNSNLLQKVKENIDLILHAKETFYHSSSSLNGISLKFSEQDNNNNNEVLIIQFGESLFSDDVADDSITYWSELEDDSDYERFSTEKEFLELLDNVLD